jgi:uncharacterized repeat protein (TIGR02543 family)
VLTRRGQRLAATVVVCLVVLVAAAVAYAAITPVQGNSGGASQLAKVIAVAPLAPATSTAFVAVPPGSPNVMPNGTANAPLAGFPTHGTEFAILTTGDVTHADDANTAPDSGTDDAGGNVRGNTDFDVTILRIDFTAPSGSNCLSFDFKFLSEEFPEFVGSSFNDAFIAELDSSNWTTQGSQIVAPNNFAFDPAGNPVSINATGATSVSPAGAAGTTYDAGTPVLRAAKQLTPGVHSLYLSIFDQGDNFFDSAVFIDNLVVQSVPNPAVQCASGAQKRLELALEPASASLTVGRPHAVTATLTEADAPRAGAPIKFAVSGANTAAGTATTDASGKATFTYTGANPGSDTITACFDVAADATCAGEDPSATASASWEALPPTPPPLPPQPQPPPPPPPTEALPPIAIGDSSLPALPNVLPEETAAVSVNLNGDGAVTGAPAGRTLAAAAARAIRCSAPRFACQSEVDPGTRVVLTAKPAPGFRFSGWTGACAGQGARCTLSAGADRTLTANFAPQQGLATVAMRLRPMRATILWARSIGNGRLLVRGRVSRDARVQIDMRRPGGGPLLTRRMSVRGGFFQLQFPLRSGKFRGRALLLPGGFVVSLRGKAGGARVPLQVQTLTLPAPGEGVVRTSFVTPSQTGARTLRLPAGAKEAWAHFQFETQPRGSLPLSVAWYRPDGSLLGSVQKSNRPEVFSFVRTNAALTTGAWVAELRAGGRVVKRLSVRVGG